MRLPVIYVCALPSLFFFLFKYLCVLLIWQGETEHTCNLSKQEAEASSRSAYFTSYHAVHEDKFEIVFIKRLVPVPVIRGPDVTGDGRGDPGICVPITGVGQQ